MKVLIDIKDDKVSFFMELMKTFSFVKTEHISTPDAELFDEIREINAAYRHAKLVKAGKLKTRPAEDLLNEL